MIGLGSMLLGMPVHGPPALQHVTPSSGYAAGGTSLDLKGRGLGAATDVLVDGDSVAFTVVSNGKLRITSPEHDLGAVDIAVVLPSGTLTLSASYTYTKSPLSVLSFTPDHGDSGDVVSGTLGGTGFRGVSSIELEPYVAGVAITVVSDSAITLDLDGPSLGASPGDSVSFRVIRTISIDEAMGTDLFTFDGPPAFDLATLDLSIFLKAGDHLNYPAPAGSGGGSCVWIGTASAGTSGGNDGFQPIANNTVDGPTLDGLVTVDFTTTNQAALSICPSDADTRAGVAAATEAPYTNHITAGLTGSTDGSFFALIYLVSISGNSGDSFDQAVMGAGTQGSILAGGAANDKIETALGFGNLNQMAVSTGQWVFIAGRYGSSVLEGAVNDTGWTTRACGSASGQTFTIGKRVGTAAAMYGALFCASPTRYDDATFSDIYAGVKALFPSAGLP